VTIDDVALGEKKLGGGRADGVVEEPCAGDMVYNPVQLLT
jgi:hypothetical protein